MTGIFQQLAKAYARAMVMEKQLGSTRNEKIGKRRWLPSDRQTQSANSRAARASHGCFRWTLEAG
jgi:hypothetical protein